MCATPSRPDVSIKMFLTSAELHIMLRDEGLETRRVEFTTSAKLKYFLRAEISQLDNKNMRRRMMAKQMVYALLGKPAECSLASIRTIGVEDQTSRRANEYLPMSPEDEPRTWKSSPIDDTSSNSFRCDLTTVEVPSEDVVSLIQNYYERFEKHAEELGIEFVLSMSSEVAPKLKLSSRNVADLLKAQNFIMDLTTLYRQSENMADTGRRAVQGASTSCSLNKRDWSLPLEERRPQWERPYENEARNARNHSFGGFGPSQKHHF
ncbi:unnamed protein product [Caenorhabditis auriculariae]|uniref:Uncharacterized protein n=1 Tax=Caenorhabditis auriculariae TaxID=2777116 RepID=A0A8S1H241_9PELO|nr:unnamed protein product [Caenorhabditis auriculariae]